MNATRRLLAKSLPGRLLKYGWNGRLDHLGFPRYIHIEGTNRCPARCTLCTRDQMKRPQGTMGLELFRKIVDECSHYPRHTTEIHLVGIGEPLLESMLPEKIRYAREHTRAYTYIVTTANIMTEKMARDIIAAGLHGIKISLYGDSTETYESVHRQLSFRKTIAALEMFLRVRDEMEAPNPKILMQFCSSVAPEKELESWARRWSPKLDADRGDILLNTTVHNWSGARASAGLHLPEAERYCSWPFKAIQIQWDGTVSPCCFDYDGSVRLGDVKTNTVKEVWTGERFEAFRRPWRERKSYSIPLCRNCDAPDGRYRTERLPDVLQPGSRGVVKRPRLSDGSSETHSRSSGAPGWALDEDFSGNEGE